MEKIFEKVKRFFDGSMQIGVFDQEKDVLWMTPAELKSLSYLRAMNAASKHIFMRPGDESRFMLCDDLTATRLENQHKSLGQWRPGRMCVQTSYASWQVWIKCDRPLTIAEKTYWLDRLGSDPKAGPDSRWGRLPGLFNRKAKHERGGKYPLVKLLWVDWRNTATIPALEKVSHLPHQEGGQCRYFPIHGPIREISRDNYDKGNESETDFAFAMALFRRGLSEDEIRSRLKQERRDWKRHKNQDAYLLRTLRRAKEMMQDL